MHPDQLPHEAEVADRVLTSSAGLDAEPRRTSGWLKGEVLELGPADLVEQVGPIHYELQVQRFDDELLVQGEVSVELGMVCVKTAELFSTIVGEKAFTESFPLLGEDEEVDLTEALREAILLTVPSHPVNPDPGTDPLGDFRARESDRLAQALADKADEGEQGVWDSLDQLDLENED